MCSLREVRKLPKLAEVHSWVLRIEAISVGSLRTTALWSTITNQWKNLICFLSSTSIETLNVFVSSKWTTFDTTSGSSVHRISQARILEWVAILPQGIFLTQGSNLNLLWFLHWQADSLPLSYLKPSSVKSNCLQLTIGKVLLWRTLHNLFERMAKVAFHKNKWTFSFGFVLKISHSGNQFVFKMH